MSRGESMIIYALRYALGRRTYAVSDVCDHIRTYQKHLSTECIENIIRDINRELKHYHDMGMSLGDTFDEQDWIQLRDVLAVELALRGEKHG